jgi:protein-tyrosine phosphatase
MMSGIMTTDMRNDVKAELASSQRRETVVASRDADGNLVVRWDDSLAPEVLHTGTFAGAIDPQQTLVVELGRNQATFVGLDSSKRHFVTLIFEGGSELTIGERILPLEGAHNFRDLGGYETAGGRRVKWGKLYRADHLANLTDGDQRYLEALGIRQVYDLRTFAEAEQYPDRLPPSIRYAHFPIFTHGPIDGGTILRQLGRLDNIMFDMYRAGLDQGGMIFAQICGQLAQPINVPAVFHCSAGKDRTGLMTALILLALGVPAETIIYDYTLTDLAIEYLISATRDTAGWQKILMPNNERLHSLLSAPPSLIEATLQHIAEKYGTVEEYLCNEGWLTRPQLEQLRNELLE